LNQSDTGPDGAKSPRPLDRYQNLILAGLAIVIAAGVLALITYEPAPVPIYITPPAPTATPGSILVYVTGAVAQPDVYTLPPDAIVKDAVEAAGGALETADLVSVNLAQRLHDEAQVHVPVVGEVPAAVQPGLGSGGKVNINTADVALLDTLPNIGESRAQAIIDYREAYGPFTSIEQIMEVPGIAEKMFEDLRDLITVD
jgi:competence protein ComEA